MRMALPQHGQNTMQGAMRQSPRGRTGVEKGQIALDAETISPAHYSAK
jgi:hypothetical protein